MTEEFSSVAFSWIELPAKPLHAGEWSSFAGAVPPDIEIESIELRHEPEPRAQGPGHYYVLAYVRRSGTIGPLWPVTASMITAVP